MFTVDLGSNLPGLSVSTFYPDHCHTSVWTAFELTKPPPRYDSLRVPSRFLSVSLVLISSLQYYRYHLYSMNYPFPWNYIFSIGLYSPPPAPPRPHQESLQSYSETFKPILMKILYLFLLLYTFSTYIHCVHKIYTYMYSLKAKRRELSRNVNRKPVVYWNTQSVLEIRIRPPLFCHFKIN